MKRLFITTLLLLVTFGTYAQQSEITDFRIISLMPDYDENGQVVPYVVAQVDLINSNIDADEAGCVVIMNNGRLPQIKTGMELIECVEDYCYGVEDLSAAKGKKSESLQIYVPMNNNLKGSEETLYLQAFVLNLEDEPKMLAKSSVVKISFEKLSTLVPKIDQDKITKDIERNMLGEILMGIFTNPDAVDDEGYKPCPKCHGKGKIQEDSWSHAEKQSEPRVYTTSTCEECDGTGRVKATEGDIEMKRSMKGLLDGFGISGGDVFDIFFGPQ